jgi:hypothetical protein
MIACVDATPAFAFLSVRPQTGREAGWLRARSQCLERFASHRVSVEMLQFMPHRMRFVVAENLVETAQLVVRACGLAWRLVPGCSKLCIAGLGIPTAAGLFYRILTILAEREIPLLHFSHSDVTMSLVVPGAYGAEATTLVQRALAASGAASPNPPIDFDAVLGRLRVDGTERRLGSRQAKLLAFLTANAGRAIEANEAAKHLFGTDAKEEIAALRVHVHNLRKKIEADPENPRRIVTLPTGEYFFVR